MQSFPCLINYDIVLLDIRVCRGAKVIETLKWRSKSIMATRSEIEGISFLNPDLIALGSS